MFSRLYLNSSTTTEVKLLSLMRPVSSGGEPSSSISVTWRSCKPQSAFWERDKSKRDLWTLFVRGFQFQVETRSKLSSLVSWYSAAGTPGRRCRAQRGWEVASFGKIDAAEPMRFSHLTQSPWLKRTMPTVIVNWDLGETISSPCLISTDGYSLILMTQARPIKLWPLNGGHDGID